MGVSRVLRAMVAASLVAGLAAAALAGAARASDSLVYRFTWQGGGGYTMEGLMSFPAEYGRLSQIVETDLSCFEVTAKKDGVEIGRWALGMLTPDTTWRLTFDPQKAEFVVYGQGDAMPQAWNMDGRGMNCGADGFGFNIGSAAQDICLDGALIYESQVPPPQSFPVEAELNPSFGPKACRPTLLLGALGR